MSTRVFSGRKGLRRLLYGLALAAAPMWLVSTHAATAARPAPAAFINGDISGSSAILPAPTVRTKVSATSLSAGETLTDTATLSGSGQRPPTVTGTVDFQLCSNTTAGCPQGTGTTFEAGVTLANGSATSRASSFPTNLAAGNYCIGLIYHAAAHASYSSTYSGSAAGECFTVTGQPALKIIKVAEPGTVSAGDPIAYKITVSNAGPGTAHGVTITDRLPAGPGILWSADTAHSDRSCKVAGLAGSQMLACGPVDLPAKGALSALVTARTTAQSCGTYDNAASYASRDGGSGQTQEIPVTVNCPQIELTKVADANPASAGDTIGYTITATNGGLGIAKGVTMTDVLPTDPGLSWTVASASRGWFCLISRGTLTCGGKLTTLAARASLSVHVTSSTTSATCGSVDNLARVTTSNDGTASAAALVQVNCPQIELVKTADESSAIAGGGIGFTISVTNAGLGNARDVTMTDVLPADPGLAWTVSSVTPGWTCSIIGGTLTCGGPGTSLAPQSGLSVDVTSPTTSGACGLVNNIASVTTSNDGSAAGQASVQVRCAPSLATRLPRHTIEVGGSVRDSARLQGASSGAGGTVRYRVYPALATCLADTSRWPATRLGGHPAGVVGVHDGQIPGSDVVTFQRAGAYYWAAFYSGDPNNAPAASRCRTEVLIVQRHPPAVTTRLSSYRITAGGSVRDLATLHGATSPVRGTVRYRYYTTLRGCRADTAAWPARPLHGLDAGVVAVHGMKVPASRPIRFRRAGTYYWAAFYSGSPRNAPAASRCLTEVLRVGRSLVSVTTWLSAHVTTVGSPVLDWATLHGVTADVRGTVQFRYYTTLRSCRADTLAWPGRPRNGVFVDRLVVRGPRTGDTRSIRFRRPGTYYWAAFYSGDGRNAPAASRCVSEVLKVR